MLSIAKKLSQKFPFVRVDFYEIQGKPYVGEMTFYPGGGYNKYEPFTWENEIGSWFDLPKINKESK